MGGAVKEAAEAAAQRIEELERDIDLAQEKSDSTAARVVIIESQVQDARITTNRAEERLIQVRWRT